MSKNDMKKPMATSLERFDVMTDDMIDTSDIPPLSDEFFEEATWRIPSPSVEMRLDCAAEELPVAELPDEQILALTKLQMDEASQSELSELQAQNREGSLDSSSSQRLDQLMGVYRYNMVRKAEAFKVATERGLLAPLNTYQSATPKERAQDFREWVARLPKTGSSLSGDAFDRDSIYE